MNTRVLLLALVLVIHPGCQFSLNRAVAPGQIRAHVAFALSDGTLTPAVGAQVVLENTSLALQADSSGAFAFQQLPAGTYVITITGTNAAAGTGLHLTGITLMAIATNEADGLDLGTLVLAPYGSIAGSVTLNGNPVSGATVVLTGIAQTTSMDGAFTFANVPSGPYSLAAIAQPASGVVAVAAPVDVVVQPRGATAATLTLTAATSGSLAGQVVLADSQAVLQASIQPETTGTSITLVQAAGAGFYSVPSLPPGLYSVIAGQSGFTSVEVRFLVVGNTTTQVPLITLIPGPTGALDAGPADGGPEDAGPMDAGTQDAGMPDAGVDAGTRDAGTQDAGIPDAGVDAGVPDAGTQDAGIPDAGVDAGVPDAGTQDAGRPDAGVDAGVPDAGTQDAGCNFEVASGSSAEVWVGTYAGNGLQGDTSLGNTIDGTAGSSGTAQISYPTALAFDSTGNLYFAEYYAARKINACGDVTTFYSNNENVSTQPDIDLPGGVAVDATGALWVASADGVIGSTSTPGVFKIASRTLGEGGIGFQRPEGLAINTATSTEYFSDGWTNDIWQMTSGTPTVLAGPTPTNTYEQGTSGFKDGPVANALFNSPQGMAIDSSGNLYVADSRNNAVREITPEGSVVTLAGNGSGGFADGSGGMTGAARFSDPMGVAVDAAGNVFVADVGNNAIRWIDPAGNVATIASSAAQGYRDGPAGVAQFNVGGGIAVDTYDNIYFTDLLNGRIRVVFLPAGYLSGAAIETADAGIDAGPPTIGSGVNVTPLPNGLDFATAGIVADGEGNIYAGDQTCGSILEITADGGTSVLAGLEGPQCESGFKDGSGASARFDVPWGIVLDSAGDVIVADSENNRIRMVSAGTASTIAGSGNAGFVDAVGAAAEFNGPWGLAVDSSDAVYVADSQNNRIRKLDLSSRTVTTIAGSGAQGYAEGPALSARFDHPAGIAVDTSGNVFIADMGNSRIRELNVATGMVSTFAGNGQIGSVDGTGGASGTAEFNLPVGVALRNGTLYVADPNNGAVRQIDPSGNVTTLMGGLLPGETFTASWAIAATPQGVLDGFQLITCAPGSCGGLCVDFDSDPLNCGTCGNACSGAAAVCNAGHCAQATSLIAPSLPVEQLLVADAKLYWTDSQANLVSALTDGGMAETLASPFRYIAVDSSNVYGAYSTNLYSVPLDGGTVDRLDPSGLDSAYELVVEGSTLYFSTGAGIDSIPTAGGSETRLVSNQTQAGSDLDFDYAITADSQNVYWGDETGGSVSLLSMSQTTQLVSTLASGLQYALVNDLAVNGTSLYAAVSASGNPGEGAIVQVSTSGGTPTTLASGAWVPYTIATDGNNVYWINATTNAVVKVSVSGGAPSTIVSMRFNSFAQSSGIGSVLAIDSTSVYWENDPYGTPTLMSAPK